MRRNLQDRVLDPVQVKGLLNYSTQVFPVAEVWQDDEGEWVTEAPHAWFSCRNDAVVFAAGSR